MNKRKILFYFFSFGIFYFNAQEIKFHSKADTISINGFAFVFKIKPAYDMDYPSAKDTVLFIYRLENKKEKLLVKHYLYRWSADCNNVFKDYGRVQVDGNKLILFTEYTQMRSDPIPDFRKRIYRVNEKGKLIFVSDREGTYKN